VYIGIAMYWIGTDIETRTLEFTFYSAEETSFGAFCQMAELMRCSVNMATPTAT